jgi:hypothetical protein
MQKQNKKKKSNYLQPLQTSIRIQLVFHRIFIGTFVTFQGQFCQPLLHHGVRSDKAGGATNDRTSSKIKSNDGIPA